MHLPVVTSAPTAAFVSEKIRGPGGLSLHLDGNSKITARNGTYDKPVANAFSIVQVKDCPGSTPICRSSCYVHHLEEHQPRVHALYKHNSTTIRQILASEPLAWAWSIQLGAHIQTLKDFRWHVSGDVFSAAYARWIASVCRQSWDTRHWIYTRSFEFVEHLKAPNLVVNLSADRDNWWAAMDTAAEHGLRICYMSDDGTIPPGLIERGDVLFPDYKYRQDHAWFASLTALERRAICPVDFFGKSETIRCGVCTKCM